MEANEAQELQEHAEHGSKESGMQPVAFTMAVLAVLVAVTTVFGHRTHTEAILDQNKATDQWNEYQAHKIRANDTALAADLLGVVTIQDKDAAKKIAKAYADHQAKWGDDLKDDKEKAEAFEAKVEQAEALLEIGLVITSVTLLTRKQVYWYMGIVFSLAGIASAASAFFLK